jgi:hypothetical protein
MKIKRERYTPCCICGEPVLSRSGRAAHPECRKTKKAARRHVGYFHAQDSYRPHPQLEQRIAYYASRAERHLPLFGD